MQMRVVLDQAGKGEAPRPLKQGRHAEVPGGGLEAQPALRNIGRGLTQPRERTAVILVLRTPPDQVRHHRGRRHQGDLQAAHPGPGHAATGWQFNRIYLE